ncbi:hypothetical protein LCGC14_1806000 [marine sediment metagenome]|uniref:Glycosyltransferase subfamily 4-like N-terminal domain-containing protein n=1 Tax=marine sediment metagenome TaxID=412755 RepID=A0A0F9HB42_9ZZZZ
MKIIVVTNHCCGRVIKQARVLKKLGYDLHLITNRLPKFDRENFKSVSYYDDKKGLDNTLSLFGDKNIFHVHNEPTWMATVIRTKYANARIVLDMHDSNYWRVEGMRWFEEDVAMQCADALVFTSKSMRDSIEKYGKPHIIVSSATLKEDFRYGAWHYWGGLVSQGGHSLPTNENPLESWRDYTALYTLMKGKKQVFAYSPQFRPGSDLDKHYINTGAKLGTFSHQDLLDRMGRHNWSLVGNLRKDMIWDLALPNKFYDAMAAGIPVVNFGCKEVEPLINAFDVGINVETVDELLERWDEHTEKRYKVNINRQFFVMERYIDKLTDLYEEL